MHSLAPVWVAAAAFATYFCMYAFRKPFAVAQYAGLSAGGVDYKTAAVLLQVVGYTLSKFTGIKVVSEMAAGKRIAAIAGLIAVAEVALLMFAITPAPWNLGWLFVNGLPLGMVWGLVFAFLEGRRFTEVLGAALCCSFILASGAVKSVGDWLIQRWGVEEFWMPAATGALFVPLLVVSLWMLSRIPPPSEEDREARAERPPMTGAERGRLLRRYGFGIAMLVLAYTVLNAYRDFRDNFAVELWSSVGYEDAPAVFTLSELPIALGVLVLAGLLVVFRDNRVAFRVSLATLFVGALLVGGFTLGFERGIVGPEAWLIVVGFGMYLPYIAFHVAVYERFLAIVREPANVGFLMYLSDAAGYAGSVSVLLYKHFGAPELSWQGFFVSLSLWTSGLLLVLFVGCLFFFRRRLGPKVVAG